MGFWIFWGIVTWLVNIGMCAWIAGMKNRSSFGWGILAAIFPGLSAMWLAGLPSGEDYHQPPGGRP
mgnify:FL=1